MCTRRGLGLTYLPETLVGRLLHLPEHDRTGATGILERMTWWRLLGGRGGLGGGGEGFRV